MGLTTRKHHTIYIDHDKFELLAKLSRATRIPQAALWREALGAGLAELRKTVELTQAEAAERAYVSCTQLRALERGSRQPTICEFLSLGEALGVDPRELFSRMLSKLHYPVGYRPVRTV